MEGRSSNSYICPMEFVMVQCYLRKSNVSRAEGFSLVELVVVLAILGVLVALLFPLGKKMQATANSIGCLSNLRQIGLAITTYASDHDQRLPPRMNGGDIIWVALGRYIDAVPRTQKSIFVCPQLNLPVAVNTYGIMATTYACNAGLFPGTETSSDGLKLNAIYRHAQVILVADAAQQTAYKGGAAFQFINPPALFPHTGDMSKDLNSPIPIPANSDQDNGDVGYLRYKHNGFVNTLMADGSARSLKKGEVTYGNVIGWR